MSVDLTTAQDQVRAAIEPQLRATAATLKTSFMETFGTLVEASHKDRLEKLFGEAAEARIQYSLATDPKKAEEYHQIFDAKMASIQTLGLAVKIVADAKAGQLQAQTINVVKEAAKSILRALGDVAMGLLKSVAAGLVQGAITGLTGGAAPALGSLAVNTAATFLAGQQPGK